MTLGSIIARLHDDAFVEETVANLDDLVLLARLRLAADAARLPLGTLTSTIVGHFVQQADDEKWLALVTAASRARDPAAACLHRMLLDALPGAYATSADVAPARARGALMAMTAERVRAHSGPAILSYGFRPFFLLGAVLAALVVAFDIWREAFLTVSAAAWVLAFVGFALSYGPLLIRPRGNA